MGYWILLTTLIYLFMASHFFNHVEGRVCEREIQVPRHEVERYTEQKRCLHYEHCWSRVVYSTRTVVVYGTETVKYCCPGYTEVSTHGGEPVCEPICSPECVNSICISPGHCECTDGFSVRISANICKANCTPSCVNANCVKDDECECHPGYVNNNEEPHSCIPLCTHGCVDGICVFPEVCSCSSSYTLSSIGNVCIPICTLECVNSRCVAPDGCDCDVGFVEGEVWNLCEPFCDDTCENAICTEPNVCTCLSGYNKVNDSSHECFPYCSTECVNGMCVAPEECGCNDGFDMDPETQLCVPECSNGCDNGRCVSPETCDCNDGWYNLNNSCVPHCEPECINGNCTAPNDCTCNNGTLKASAYHCLMICDDSSNDHCFHETHIMMPSIAIRLTGDEPSVDLPSNGYSLSVPCNYLSTLESGFHQRDYQCYTYLNFDEESVVVTCSVEIETMAAADSYNQTQNFTEWIANKTSLESRFVKMAFVHRDISRYCTAQLCSNSNTALYLNAVSTIRVCMEQKTDDKKTERKSRVSLILISGASFILLVALLIPAVRYSCKLKKVSYVVNTRHHQTSSRRGILQEGDSCGNLSHEQFDTVELAEDNEESVLND